MTVFPTLTISIVHTYITSTLIDHLFLTFSKQISKFLEYFKCKNSMNVGPCYHGMARPQVADGGTASYMEGSCE
jgi:hypothetical protein